MTLAVTVALLCFTMVAGECPQQTDNIYAPVVYQLNVNTDGLSQAEAMSLMKSYLENVRHKISQENLAVSCKQISELEAHRDSGYYWIQRSTGVVGVYCEMGNNNTFGASGGWMRIANVDMRKNHSQCPSGLNQNTVEGRKLCVTPTNTRSCSSTLFNAHGVEYSRVCGKVIGYQYYFPNGFGPSFYTGTSITGPYVDGVSITHGSPRQHVWTLAAAKHEIHGIEEIHDACPCLHPNRTFAGIIPDYVGMDYYCETGSRERRTDRYYFDDPLWDGEGCEGENECCKRGGPWFCKTLPQPTQDNIELRICGNEGRKDKVLLEQIELYIQ